MITDINHQITSRSDLFPAEKITRAIIGALCWKIGLKYADELVLEIGARIPHTHPKLLGKEKGEWRLGSRGTGWVLLRGDETIVNFEADAVEINQKVQAVEDTTITRFEITYPELGLNVGFNNGYTLKICPTPEDAEDDLSYWELYCPPDRMVLEFGPGNQWWYTRSGRPHAGEDEVEE